MTSQEAFDNFKKSVYKKTGIDLNQYKEKQMRRRLNSLLRKRGFEKYGDYWNAIRKDQQLTNKGVYPQDRVKGVRPDFIDKYFTKDGNSYQIHKKIRECVTFEKQNMLEDKFGHNFDLILCRNVMIYFTEEAKSELYKKFYNALKKGGILFVGSTEQIFDARKLGFKSISTFFYQK